MKIKVGLVDDHQLFLKSLALMLETLQGFEIVLEALNGQDLQQKITQAKNLPDILLLDVNMPVMDGFAATKKLREEYFYTKPIVAITADAFAGQDNNLQSLGFTDSIVKPFDRTELAQKLVSLTKPAATQA